MQQRHQGFRAGTAIVTLLAAAMLTLVAGCGGGDSGSGGGSGAGVQPPSSGTSDAAPPAVAQALKDDTPVDPAIVSADNAFGLSLFDALLPDANGGNIANSPLSVAMALQILYNGAAGATQQAMAQTLDLGTLSLTSLNNDNPALQASLTNPDPAVQLVVANSLWLDQNSQVSTSFTQTDQTFYGAMLGDLAGAPANVNAWVASETQGLITELMQETGTLPYASGTLYGSSYQALRIPYGQGRFSMLIILPATGTDVTSFAANLTSNDLSTLATQVEHKTVVEVDETGTVAAAATGIGITAVAAPVDTMIMDRPFFYAIEDDRTGELLFVGVLMNPSSAPT